jgi:hypothetical protein
MAEIAKAIAQSEHLKAACGSEGWAAGYPGKITWD